MAEHPHDALDRFWDAVVTGEAREPTGLDATIAATVRRLHAAQPRSGANPRFVADLWDELSRGDPPAERAVPLRHHDRGPVDARPIPRSPVDGAGTDESRRWLPILLSAALLVLTLGVALGARLPGRFSGPDHSRAPAVYAPASPSPAATPDETVLELTLPATALPTGDGVGAGLAVFTIAPGTRSTWDQTCCPGVLVEYVLSGQYTVRAAAAITVVRAGGAVEDIPARIEVILNPGDALVSRDEVGVEAANTGAEPVSLLSWLLIEGAGTFDTQRVTHLWAELWPQFTGHKLPGWVEGLPGDIREMSDVQGPVSLDAAPATIRLRRVTVPDDSVVPLPVEGVQFVAPVGPHADKLRQADMSLRILGEIGQPVTVYILTLQQADP